MAITQFLPGLRESCSQCYSISVAEQAWKREIQAVLLESIVENLSKDHGLI